MKIFKFLFISFSLIFLISISSIVLINNLKTNNVTNQEIKNISLELDTNNYKEIIISENTNSKIIYDFNFKSINDDGSIQDGSVSISYEQKTKNNTVSETEIYYTNK